MSVVSTEPSAERWDEATKQAPARLGTIGRLIIAILVVVVMGGGALVLQRLPLERWLPLHSVVFEGHLVHVSKLQLRSAIGPLLHGGLLGVDLTAIRLAVEALPWVDHATVHRVWPDALRVTLVEQVAVARWGKSALLNDRGEVFRPSVLPSGLPRLAGPKGSESQVLREFHRFQTQLRTVGLQLAGLTLDDRRSWTAELSNGAVIRVGRNDVKARMRRFTAAWPRINAHQDQALLIADLRYPNGFSIRWGKPTQLDHSQGHGT